MRPVAWNDLDDAARTELLSRPTRAASAERAARVGEILDDVRTRGDEALLELTATLDGVRRDAVLLDEADRQRLLAAADPDVVEQLRRARATIEAFHAPGGLRPYAVETAPGVTCERIVRPLRRVGCYVPAGSAPLPSTVLMLGVPARLAGVGEVVACTPPGPNGDPSPLVVAALDLVGVTTIAVVGGAQAVAAMAFGTESVPRCDKVVGPGNEWVTEAKRQVSATAGGCGIDVPAGPSEQLVIADAGANPAWVAADLLSQAEHGPDSQVVLVTDAPALADAVAAEVSRQLATLPRADIVAQALAASRLVVVDDLATACDVSNAYAPEHLIVATRAPRELLPRLAAAGSIFLGDLAPESLGDYCSGTNHVLPTGGAARHTGGVSVASFQTAISVQEVEAAGLATLGPTAVAIARAEGLEAHARAVTVRMG